jgi:hypothetical protein
LLPGFNLPTLSQVQNYVSRMSIGKNANDIEGVQEFIASNYFNAPVHIPSPNSFFFYGMELDTNGRPIVGDGSIQFPCRIHMTSMALLKYLDDQDQGNRAVFHIGNGTMYCIMYHYTCILCIIILCM